jgi:chloramphenicol-sensitive protein RarD
MRNKGILFALGCYGIWGVFPAYWKLVAEVPALQLVSHRLVWSFAFLMIVMTIMREWEPLRAQTTPRALKLYFLSGALLTVNWLAYIYGVNTGRVVEASLGYFINPLVSVLLGVIFFRERLQPVKWLSIALAAAGVLYLTISYGQPPWISLILAFSFGLYGLIKKLAPLGALHGLTVETLAMFLPALGYLIFVEANGTGSFGHTTTFANVIMIMGGVITAIPLLLFAGAAKRIPLSMIGFMQYITPTMQLFLGVFAYGEPFTTERIIGFSIIWLALIILTVSGLLERRKTLANAAA